VRVENGAEVKIGAVKVGRAVVEGRSRIFILEFERVKQTKGSKSRERGGGWLWKLKFAALDWDGGKKA